MKYEAIPEATEAVARSIIGAAIAVHRALGPGFLERVYREALCYELASRSVPFETEKPIVVRYRNLDIKCQRADMVVDARVIVELKAISRLDGIHEAIVMSYLRSTRLRLGLLMNFHAPTLKEGLKRIVL
ncbi:MAG: GxxExxY protein [Vicinamibacterales bacterium]